MQSAVLFAKDDEWRFRFAEADKQRQLSLALHGARLDKATSSVITVLTRGRLQITGVGIEPTTPPHASLEPGEGAKGCSQQLGGREICGRADGPAAGQGAMVYLRDSADHSADEPPARVACTPSRENSMETATPGKRRRSGGGRWSSEKRLRRSGVAPFASSGLARAQAAEAADGQGVEEASELALETAKVDIGDILMQRAWLPKVAIHQMAGASVQK